ncbi:hypothetical protein BE17_14235 [Sorangium cellulosum]|uniref:Uncharacterized protein n=1 Tax=Sorangium cellulosum TaxID=56 RepID=A0A150RPP6_SORCE|nr:hypothetical protein BE17_14235 [Sorangium cellulosum]
MRGFLGRETEQRVIAFACTAEAAAALRMTDAAVAEAAYAARGGSIRTRRMSCVSTWATFTTRSRCVPWHMMD